jgi:hypothetical protein
MEWDGRERRNNGERRVFERRRTMRYNVKSLVIVDGITWVDPEGNQRRTHIRRRDDRETLAIKIVHLSRP